MGYEERGSSSAGKTKVSYNPYSSILLLILVVSLCSCYSTKVTVKEAAVVEKPAPEITPVPETPYCSIDLEFPLSAITNPKLYIYKSDRRLLLVEHDTLIRDYHVALGPHPNGDKYYQGDGRTPEGEFYVCVKNSASKYYKSLGLSYPTPKHAEDAFMRGIISEDEFLSILQAHQSKTKPPWNTSLGGAIMIHGGGTRDDWTLGCIAVYNSAIDEIFAAVPVGTPVQILP